MSFRNGAVVPVSSLSTVALEGPGNGTLGVGVASSAEARQRESPAEASHPVHIVKLD